MLCARCCSAPYRLLVSHERTEAGYADQLLHQFHHALIAA